jgi:GDP-L-fucose synthase
MPFIFLLLFALFSLFAEEIPLDAKIYVAGHRGLVGQALVRKLRAEGYVNLVLRARDELDLTDQRAVETFFEQEKPEYVFLAAAKVGGIWANFQQPASFIYENLRIEINVIHSAYLYGVKKLLFLGSSCIYPRDCPQPIQESSLLTSPLEMTNEPYAVAKIAGIKLCQSYNRQYGTRFICCMPTNLYGPEDHFDLASSHVLPALIAKIEQARLANAPSVQIWGTGNPRREFLHVDDLADAALFLMRCYEENEIINIGSGKDVTIRELAEMIQREAGWTGELLFDTSKPDGTFRKWLDVSKLKALGWSSSIELEEGVKQTIAWYRESL